MPTINIPHATIRPPGRTADNPIGPFSVPAGMTSFVLSAPLSQDIGEGNSFDVAIERQTEIGGEWQRFAGFGLAGGYDGTDPLGCAAEFFGGQPFDAMQVQMVITVAGAALNVASGGTLVVA